MYACNLKQKLGV